MKTLNSITTNYLKATAGELRNRLFHDLKIKSVILTHYDEMTPDEARRILYDMPNQNKIFRYQLHGYDMYIWNDKA